MDYKQKMMFLALKEADKAIKIDEVPVGCVICRDGKIIAKGYNKKESNNDVTGHAEIIAIKKASKKLKDWRLTDCEMFVTVEPCIMCSGAIIQSRIGTLYFGAYDSKGGAFGSSIDITKATNLNHKIQVISGILKKECESKIKNYFRNKRKKKE